MHGNIRLRTCHYSFIPINNNALLLKSALRNRYVCALRNTLRPVTKSYELRVWHEYIGVRASLTRGSQLPAGPNFMAPLAVSKESALAEAGNSV